MIWIFVVLLGCLFFWPRPTCILIGLFIIGFLADWWIDPTCRAYAQAHPEWQHSQQCGIHWGRGF